MTRIRLTNKLISIAILLMLAAIVLITPLSNRGFAGEEATFCLGFILLFGYYLAKLLNGIRLPAISGYILAGVIAGPFGINLLSKDVVRALQLFDDAALAIIALIAGGEMKLSILRARAGSFFSVIVGQVAFAFIGAGIISIALVRQFSSTMASGVAPILAVALLLGLVTAARSPSTTIGIVTETRSRGPLTELIIGVTVILDVLLLVLIAFIVPMAKTLATTGQTFSLFFAKDLFVEVFGSIGIGVFFGAMVGSYIRWVGGYLPLFLVGIGFVGSLVCRYYNLEPLLAFMIAGFVVENYSKMGDDLIRGLEKSAFPVYVIFFAISGASIDLSSLRAMWSFAIVLVVVRAASFYAGGWLAGRVSRDVRPHISSMWLGYLSQAGVTIGLASIIERNFSWGSELKTLILAVVAINQLIGPVFLRWLLEKKGETGGMDRI
ncbi:MAG: hypothetical protein GTO51_02000 [Candidatus Latescibacteria bacterium]|nr:hypothetical protein [Candidatus Latescibacterota bacterium]NIM64746.1 hypothetical protein [Candidatus Latescibacterota bacterium]NIO01256.1 hypothetical protein [Candidatus Latescibacterota bacterium]NIO27641.1 hypothetical protein [Candidatus Latescibacterota bacterium]NIO55173.1 hypothetical protein [Candidatus Latescibacterota bacterium]